MILRGKNICSGYAYGRLAIHKRTELTVVRRKCEDAEAEIAKFHEARQKAKEEYEQLYNRAVNEIGNANAALFRADLIMLDDVDYIESVANIIRSQKVNVEYAVAVTIDNYTALMKNVDDAYIREREQDVRDVYNKVIEILSSDKKVVASAFTEPVILLAEDLTPSEIVRLDKTNIIGFVMSDNHSNSHTAILSRSLNIPALVGVDLYGYVDDKGNITLSDEIAPELDGKMAILDGFNGRLIIEPGEDEIELYKNRISKEKKNRELLDALKGKKTVTKSGKTISLYANINNEKDIVSALKNDAEGVGLYRSEYLYMGRDEEPSEEEQVSIYRMMAENMGGKRIVIRTADIGADKQVPYIDMDAENNPALGYRGIRVSLDRREMFTRQLRAILRASYYGNIAMLLPMITSLEEVLEVKQIIENIKDELKLEGYPYKECELGVMIETPAAVIISDLLAKEVDFFSIGTNDLSQYTLAADRTNTRLDKYYKPDHEAVMRQIKMAIDNAHANNCRVGICGEIASDENILPRLIEYGIDEVSVSPVYILPVRETIRNTD